MKILQLVTKRQFRGAEVFAAELSGMLIKKGHQILFTGLYMPPQNALQVPGAINVDLGGRKLFINPMLLLRLIVLIIKKRPDIIQANGSDTLKYAVFAKLFLPRIKIVYRNISMVSSWMKKGSLKQKFNKWLFTKVDFVSSVGNNALNDLISAYDFPKQRTAVVKRGIPCFNFDKNEQRKWLILQCGFKEVDQILMHVGQFSEEKNHQFLISCFEKIVGVVPTAKLVLLGEGKLQEQMNSLVLSKGLASKVYFAGYQKEVQKWLAASDLFLLTSNVEGVPGVILEAGMQNVPAVAVNVGGVSEAVLNHQSGILTDGHNENDFVKAVCLLLDDEALRLRLGKQSGHFVREKFGLDQCCISFEIIYRNVVK